MGKKRAVSDEDTPKKKNDTKEQPSVAAFFQPPSSKKHKTNKSITSPVSSKKADAKGKGKAIHQAIEVIDLSSGDEKPVASTSKLPAPSPVVKKAKAEDADVKPDIKPDLSRSIGFAHTASSSTTADIVYPLDKDIFHFNPLIDIDSSSWPGSGKQIPYSFLTAAFVLISSTRSRLIIVTVLTNTLRTIAAYQPEVLLSAVYLITNQ